MPTTVINSCIKILTIHMLREIQELLVEMLQHDAAKRPDAQTIVDKVELMTSKTGKNLFYKYFQILKYFEIVNLVFHKFQIEVITDLRLLFTFLSENNIFRTNLGQCWKKNCLLSDGH